MAKKGRTWGIMAKKREKKPTIEEIKRNTKKALPYYFDTKAMKFFGQKLSDYKVHQCRNGKIYIYAKSMQMDYRTGKKDFMGYSIRQYVPNGLNSDLKMSRKKLIEITNC